MEKRGIFLSILFFFVIVLSTFSVSAGDMDSEIQKLTGYAEEYESGNINYAQLTLYLANTRQKMNQIFGVINKPDDQIVKGDQLRAILGKETEKTRWAWNQRQQREQKQKEDIRVWRKIIFDGNKITIWFNAWPTVYGKEGEEEIVYHLDVRTEFKKEKQKINIEKETEEIKELAEKYQKDPSNTNANELAVKTVSTEMKF